MTKEHPQGWSVDDMRRVAHARLERLPHGDLGNGYYRNPVLVGGGGDNTVVRVGADYYMLAGGGWPGLLVWHSRDLVNWRPITRALHRGHGLYCSAFSSRTESTIFTPRRSWQFSR